MFRPWGLMDWTLALSEQRKWYFVGALGSEERSLAALQWLTSLGLENGRALIQIEALPSRFYEATLSRLAERQKQFALLGGSPDELRRLPLLAPLHAIDRIAAELEQRSQSVVLDISALPKRFFFPLLRAFFRSTAIRDLVVTYTSPAAYATGDVLSEEPGAWEYLPGFIGESPAEKLIVGIGFLVESLQQSLSAIEAHKAIQLLIPFPGPLSEVQRSWEALFKVRDNRAEAKFAHHRIDPLDLSAAFTLIRTLADADHVPAAFAPFGPKPISAAMCLYASMKGSAVYYPQPRYYNPDYSTGVRVIEGRPAVRAYWIKHAGVSLYS